MSYVADALAVLASFTLIIAGASKVSHPREFGSQVIAFQILPRPVARAAGYVLPSIEVAVGVLALIWRPAGVLVAILFLTFTVAIASNLLRGRSELRCGCFGPSGRHTINWASVGVDVGLAASAAIGANAKGVPSRVGVQAGVSLVLVVITLAAMRTNGVPVFRPARSFG